MWPLELKINSNDSKQSTTKGGFTLVSNLLNLIGGLNIGPNISL